MPVKRGARATGESWRDHYRTPTDFLNRARMLWGIDEPFDPFPVNYSELYGDMWSGFQNVWGSFAWVNPPFSRYKEAVAHGLQQPTEQLWICAVDNSTKWFQALWDASSGICLLNSRVRFIDPRTGEQTKGTDIGKGNAIFYRGNNPGAFSHHFQDLGRIILKTEGNPHVLGI
jgi:hypothetical protein